MQRLLSIALSCLFAVSLSAQEPSITYPYNPDSNTDSLIGASDLVDFLPFYGEEFTPEPLTIEGMSVEEWMEQQTSSSGGGCDVLVPDGLNNVITVLDTITPESPYIIPQGKNLYIVTYTDIDNCEWCTLSINTILEFNQQTTASIYSPYACPLIFSDNQTLTVSNGCTGIIGFLVDKRVDPVLIANYISSPYIVPENKVLYVMKLSGTVKANGIALPNFDTAVPIVLESGTVLYNENNGDFWCNGSSTNGTSSLNGYLVDEDYFADCGGGGGVDISGLQEQIDAVAADSYAADAALLTASDNADDELQAQIDEAVSNLQEQLDSALASNENLQEQLDEMQNDNVSMIWDTTDPQNSHLNGDIFWFPANGLESTIVSLFNSDTLIIPEGLNMYISNISLNNCEMKLLRNGDVYWQYPRDFEDKKLEAINANIYTENDTIVFFAEIGGTESNSISIGSTLNADLYGATVQVSSSLTPVYEYYKASSNPEYIVPENSKLKIKSFSTNVNTNLEIEHPVSGILDDYPVGYIYNYYWPSGTRIKPLNDDQNGWYVISGYLIND